MTDRPAHDALVLHQDDHVATALAALAKGQLARVRRADGAVEDTEVREQIRYGHKFAVRPIRQGEHILKYGESIGVATGAVEPGEHVHTHNVESLRGRGDLAEAEAAR